MTNPGDDIGPPTADALAAAGDGTGVAGPLRDTRLWLERAVIGLNLCPFAKAVLARRQVRFVLSEATTPDSLLEDLLAELIVLRDADPQAIDTTLLVHPQVLGDFLDYNDFLERADDAVEALELDGVIQVASFHPRYQFAGTAPDDIGNYSNRAPYPTLHLLREDSVSRAVDAYPDPDAIIDRNLATLDKLGIAGWRALGLGVADDAQEAARVASGTGTDAMTP